MAIDNPVRHVDMTIQRRRRPWLFRGMRNIGVGQRIAMVFVWLFILFNLGVFAWLALSSFRSTREIFSNPLGFPSVLQFDNYARAWEQSKFGPAVLNTLVVVIASAVLIVVIAAPAAYVLARASSRSAGPMLGVFTVGMGIPFQVILVPLFVIMQKAHLVNSLLGVTLLYIGVSLPFTVVLLTSFFRSLPEELEEAATLDGASPSRTFFSVMLPLARSGLLTGFLLNAITLWNETFISLIFLQSGDKQTLSLALLGFLQRQQYNGADYGGLFAGVCLLVLPTLILYIIIGRQMIEGMTLGAGK